MALWFLHRLSNILLTSGEMLVEKHFYIVFFFHRFKYIAFSLAFHNTFEITSILMEPNFIGKMCSPQTCMSELSILHFLYTLTQLFANVSTFREDVG